MQILCDTQLYLNEHGLTPDGRVTEGSPSENDDGFSTFFSETGSGKVRARVGRGRARGRDGAVCGGWGDVRQR
jgi:hypothetical protein